MAGGAGPGVEVEAAVGSISNRVAFRPDLVRVWTLCGPEKSDSVKLVRLLFEVFRVSGGFRVEFVGNWSNFSKNGGANWNDLWFGVGCGGARGRFVSLASLRVRESWKSDLGMPLGEKSWL